jgi:hypothetical protein
VTTRKATHARLATVLEAIPNVGASLEIGVAVVKVFALN